MYYSPLRKTSGLNNSFIAKSIMILFVTKKVLLGNGINDFTCNLLFNTHRKQV